MNTLTYEIVPLPALIIGGIGSVFFGGAATFSVALNLPVIMRMTAQSWVFIILALFFMVLFFFSLLLVLYCQKIVISEDGIGIKRVTKFYSVPYSEISYFYENSGNINIGNTRKQISFPAYEYWSGKDKDEAYVLLTAKLAERNVHREVSLKGLIPRIKGFKASV